ncbi:hypothetical protein AFLA_005038 [Aspergillus flavus NRRL3357]|nr:hypothetical protein AFLA_005038 [Aspergillus flavus NRRL3357]
MGLQTFCAWIGGLTVIRMPRDITSVTHGKCIKYCLRDSFVRPISRTLPSGVLCGYCSSGPRFSGHD